MVDFEYYVLNEDRNSHEIKPYNIFRNLAVHEATNKLCEDFDNNKLSFDSFVDELDKVIRWQEWGRCEYEICVAEWPPTFRDKNGKRINVYYGQEHEPIDSVDMWKVDCYEQAHPNIKMIAKYVLDTYYGDCKYENK